MSSVDLDLLFNAHSKFELSTVIYNEEMKGQTKSKNSCFDPTFSHVDTIPACVAEVSLRGPQLKLTFSCLFKGLFVITMVGLDTAYMRTKFSDYSFSRSRDMVDAQQNLNGSCDDYALFCDDLSSAAIIYYDPANYQI